MSRGHDHSSKGHEHELCQVAADAEPSRSGRPCCAVRRYRVMVFAVAILGFVVGVGYSLMQPKVYRAQAFITMPQQVSLQVQQANSGQYLDGQVLLLQSQSVAQRAATIANATLHSNSLTSSDFFGTGSSLQISPPTTAAPGAYGATVVGVSFAASTAQIARWVPTRSSRPTTTRDPPPSRARTTPRSRASTLPLAAPISS